MPLVGSVRRHLGTAREWRISGGTAFQYIQVGLSLERSPEGENVGGDRLLQDWQRLLAVGKGDLWG